MIFEGDKFSFTAKDESVVRAMRVGIVGMRVGGIRRIEVRPENGWRFGGKDCDGGPGGAGNGGDVKTDYTIVPTAKMVNQEICFDKTKRPFPDDYARGRRLAQRFDQEIILEVEILNPAAF